MARTNTVSFTMLYLLVIRYLRWLCSFPTLADLKAPQGSSFLFPCVSSHLTSTSKLMPALTRYSPMMHARDNSQRKTPELRSPSPRRSRSPSRRPPIAIRPPSVPPSLASSLSRVPKLCGYLPRASGRSNRARQWPRDLISPIPPFRLFPCCLYPTFCAAFFLLYPPTILAFTRHARPCRICNRSRGPSNMNCGNQRRLLLCYPSARHWAKAEGEGAENEGKGKLSGRGAFPSVFLSIPNIVLHTILGTFSCACEGLCCEDEERQV
ncbi:hypothetical protein B0T22DRAFT_62088 [Podospora appendiculata]|uniref:Uncharacterized protein n=1 Tax=Podospora appendiculata TaxID=314037 RepID=A0AAE0XII9_9PEZI|nr:hypothetical protein B0T22DRAFT_62088 [Podospora appendiculata]